MRMMNALRATVATLAASMMLAAPVAAQSLTDTLIAAYRNSNLLEQNRAVLRAADEDVAQAVAALRPVVNFVAQSQAQFSRDSQMGRRNQLSASLGLSASVTLYDFGRGQMAVQGAKEQVLGVRAALLGLEQQVLLNAVAAFMDVRSAADTVALRESNVRLITQEVRAARERFDVGEGTRTDIAIAEARLAGARSQLASAEGDLKVAREDYKFATGAYPGQLRPPPALPRLARSLEAAQEVARANHPSIRQAQHDAAAADIAVERAATQRLGSVSGSASANVGVSRNLDSVPPGTSRTGDSRSLTLGLEYSRPLYSGGALPSAQRQAMARRDAARSGLHQTVAQVLQNVAQAWARMEVAAASIEASERQIRAAQTAYDGVREEAALGARTTLEVLDAEQELADARAALVQAQAGLQLAAYSVLESMGLLTVEDLNLGIPTYDPEAYFNLVRDAPARSPQGEALDRVLQSLGRQ